MTHIPESDIDTARDLIDQAIPDLHDRARRWLNRIDHALRGGGT